MSKKLPKPSKVTQSCGCVFCDIKLKPDKDGMHVVNEDLGLLYKCPLKREKKHGKNEG